MDSRVENKKNIITFFRNLFFTANLRNIEEFLLRIRAIPWLMNSNLSVELDGPEDLNKLYGQGGLA